MARLLHGGGFSDEAREPLLNAVEALGRMVAIEQRLPEPDSARHAVEGPLAACHPSLSTSLVTLCDGDGNGDVDWPGLLDALAWLLRKS